ncbi:uncharacterized protein LOC119735646 [Patiria miniata]|uniref:CCHC-type domain-containing protein n=1 Tax=Patiria miniata TaxID=46514 RepID=A0A914ANP5_PATMI|nr:uncharacterized protein LOC119735646 [Patiria miniata]
MSTSSDNVQTEMFDKFKDYFDAKFSAISQPEDDSTALKELKLKLEANDLSRPGNIAQFEFCGQLEILLLYKIQSALTTENNTGAVLQALQEGLDLLADRKQTIRIADSSKAGWGTIFHLDKRNADKLSAEQHKKVLAAKEAALKDIETRKRRRNESPQLQQSGSNSKPAFGHPDRYLFRGMSSFESCFSCGMSGHWSRNCPYSFGSNTYSRFRTQARSTPAVPFTGYRPPFSSWHAPSYQMQRALPQAIQHGTASTGPFDTASTSNASTLPKAQ